jgi:hypothetical protein
MGLFRRKDERAIPEPGSPEFEAAVESTALPDSQSVSMGEEGWTRPEPGETRDDAEQPRRPGALIRALGGQVPNSGGFAAGLPKTKKKKPRPGE